MDYKASFHSALKTSWVIIKLVIPIYILADILFYYNVLSHIAFLVEPFTKLMGLPPEASLAIISGIFLNEYATIAFAAPLDLSIKQWTILAIFSGTCHALIVEGVIMKKIGISNRYSYTLRLSVGFLLAYLTSLIPDEYFKSTIVENTYNQVVYNSFTQMIQGSFVNSLILAIKIIALISIIMFIMDYIKSLDFIKNSKKNVSKGFSLSVGMILGVTYGAGILIKEAESGRMSKYDIFYVSTFLLICHSIVEDTLLFVIFGADLTLVILIRTIAAIIISYILLQIYIYHDKKKAMESL